MNKIIIVSVAIVMSTSAAVSAKTHHMKKPAAAPMAATSPAPTQLFVVSAADKSLYAQNKRASGMK